MTTSTVGEPIECGDGFRHEAFFYHGDHEFVTGATAFLRQAVAAQEPVLVVVSSRKIDLLKAQLRSDGRSVLFADMQDVGVNPARIIPAWSDFVEQYGERPLRGIGEPIWAERSADELVECQRHESLLNVAFGGSSDFTLMCPYDTKALGGHVVDEARRSHRYIRHGHGHWKSDDYLGTEQLGSPFSAPLAPPPATAVDLIFGPGSLGEVRALVRREAMAAGLDQERAAEAVVAVNEVASNSLRHAGGRGVLRMWRTSDTFLCEVSDDGRIDQPLVGRSRPGPETPGGRGLWMVNQLCELVQVRSFAEGTTIRMHLRLRSD